MAASSSSFSDHFDLLLGGTSERHDDITGPGTSAIAQLQSYFQGKGKGKARLVDAEIDELLQRELPLSAEEENGPLPFTSKNVKSRTNGSSSAATASALDWLKSITPSSESYDKLCHLLSSSNRSNDEISSDLLDILGFEAIDLIPQVLSRRQEVKHEVEGRDSRLASQLQNTHLNGATATSTPAESESEDQGIAQHGGRRKQRGKQPGRGHDPKSMKFSLHSGMSIEELEQMHLQKLEEAANRPLVSNANGHRVEAQIKYPHVYANTAAASAASVHGTKFMLPVGTVKTEHQHYTETSIPTPAKHPSAYTAKLLPIKSLPELLQRSFPYKELNRLQSLVYPTAFDTTENMLVCAPTGAGKTDVAVLTVLRAIHMYANVRMTDGKMQNTDWKVVYVAPMKALASEIVVKMSKRFGWCGLKVRELTGDMQLTRQEIAETQMIVTTPEKWDVVTRKTTGEGELASRLRLLIIDEVHLLHEDRGAVLESIVARTLRQVESSQTLIRIVGLSATLPNYVDVADFLRVNPMVGLFYFDSSFRPVPLEQHFIAAKGKPGSMASRENLDHATYEKALDLVKEGHQVLIFVHARKDTVKTGQMIREKAMEDNEMEWFDSKENPALDRFRREIGMSRNREMKELVDASIGIHHAGMLRSDRNLSERLFEQNVTKILVCTATLAWGVNLPAYAVIIKGTQLYDSSKGAFMDLSILDVLQMFGRAGRPQYETHGVSYICTTSDKVDHYITAVSQQVPIESKFVEGLIDSLNAEISLGTVTTIDEGVRWLGYTFLYVRMRKNPMVYGLAATDLFSDPALGTRRRQLVENAAKILLRNGMVQYDPDLETLVSTELGQIASKYYIRAESIEIFNSIFKPQMTEADLLAVISKSTEFKQVAVRDLETDELKRLIETVIPCQVKGGTDSSDGKANVLLQAYVSKAMIDDFALISDMSYVAQNAGRIARALQEIAMSRKWSQSSASLIAICKAVEKRLWPWSHPLEQLGLSHDILYNINRWADDLTVEEIIQETPADFGKRIHLNERLGAVAISVAQQLPRLAIGYKLQPLSSDLLRVRLTVSKDFVWSAKLHKKAEYFWIWLSDSADRDILQLSKVIMREGTKSVQVDFTVLLENIPSQLVIRAISDTWLGSESTIEINLSSLTLPPKPLRPRQLLDLPYQISNLHPHLLELVKSRQTILSAFEVQCLHSLYFSIANVLIAAPSSDARYQLMTVPLWRNIKQRQSSKALLITPTANLARQLHSFITQDLKFANHKHGISVHRAARQADMDKIVKQPNDSSKHIVVVTTSRAMSHLFTRNESSPPFFQNQDLVIVDDLNALSAEYEQTLSYILDAIHAKTRIVGFSAPLLDPLDLAAWLRVDAAHAFAFHPSSRPVPVVTSTTTFNIPHSPGLLKAMVKPAYDAMRTNSGNSIVFVPHRGQCYNTLTDLLTHSATDLDNKFVEMDEEVLGQYTARISDPKVAEGLLHGFAVLSESMHPQDQVITKHLFSTGAVRVLIVPREACNSLELTASLVLVLATQYAVYQTDSSERQIIDYPLADLLQMQTRAVGNSQDQTGTFQLFTQADSAALISRFLADGLPLESSLPESDILLHSLLSSMISGSVKSRQTLLEALSTTYLSHRVASNPSYYDVTGGFRQDSLSHLVDDIVARMWQLRLVQTRGDDKFRITEFGREVSRRKVSQASLTLLMDCKEERALKFVGGSPLPAGIDGLDDFVKRLAKSSQRKMKADDDEDTILPGRALIIAFLSNKLPLDNIALENAQAKLAFTLLDKLESMQLSH